MIDLTVINRGQSVRRQVPLSEVKILLFELKKYGFKRDDSANWQNTRTYVKHTISQYETIGLFLHPKK